MSNLLFLSVSLATSIIVGHTVGAVLSHEIKTQRKKRYQRVATTVENEDLVEKKDKTETLKETVS